MAISRFCLCLIITCCTGSCAQAWWDDWEVETFTRYRIDNFDNNNNGYVDVGNDAARVDRAESAVLADEIVEQAVLPELDAPFLTQDRQIDGMTVPTFSDVGGYIVGRAINVTNLASYDDFRFFSIDSPILRSNFTQYQYINTEDNLEFFPIVFGADRRGTLLQNRGFVLERTNRLRSISKTESFLARHSILDFSYGVTYQSYLNDYFMWGDSKYWQYISYTSNRFDSYTYIDTQLMGPHFGLSWTLALGKWSCSLGGTAQYAAQLFSGRNNSTVSSVDLWEGNTRVHIDSTSRMSSVSNTVLGDLRMEAGRQLTKHSQLSVGYVQYYLGEIRSAAEATHIETTGGANILDVRGTDVSVGMAYLQFALQW